MQKMRFEFNTNEVNNIEILAELFPSCVTENEGNKKVIDFDKLKLINPDCIAWLKVEGTSIKYPIVKGSDNSFYLKHSLIHIYRCIK